MWRIFWYRGALLLMAATCAGSTDAIFVPERNRCPNESVSVAHYEAPVVGQPPTAVVRMLTEPCFSPSSLLRTGRECGERCHPGVSS